MSDDLQEVQKATDRLLARLVGALLRKSKYRGAQKWPSLVAVFTPERVAILHRFQLAAEFGAAGLHDAAHECAVRRVGPGEFLVYHCLDSEVTASVGFWVVRLRA
jgi:hypothetical protein